MVALESLLGEEEVLSARLEKRLKRAKNFDPTVRSRSKFYRSFWRLLSLGLLRNRYSVMRRGLVGKTSETGQNGHNFWYDRWIALKCLHEFL
jgi:hypothetical protein